MMRWLFHTPARLYGAMVGVLVVCLVMTVALIGVRLAGLPDAPRSQDERPVASRADDIPTVLPGDKIEEVAVDLTEVGNVEDAAREVVAGEGRGEPVGVIVTARDGVVQVAEVTTSTGETAEVVLIVDGPSFVLDSISW